MRLSLQQKYAILLFLVIVVVAGLISFAAIATYRENIRSLRTSIDKDISEALTDQLTRRAKALADILTEELINPLYRYDLSVILSTLRSVRGGPDVMQTLVIDENCRIVHDGFSDIPLYNQEIDAEHCSKALASDGQLLFFDKESVTVTNQFIFGDQILGLLMVKLSLKDTNARIAELEAQFNTREKEGISSFIYYIVTVSFLFSILSLFIARYLASKLIRPIEMLRYHIMEIGKGNYDTPVVAHKGDELQDLVTAFDAMRLSLSHSTVSIEKLKKEIEEKEEAERQKTKIEHRLLQAEKMEGIGQLAAGVAHDLNNILSGIVSLPQLLLMQLPEDSPLRPSLKTIEKSGNHAAMIVQDMLTLSKGGVATEDVVNLGDVVSEYVESLESRRLKDTHPGIALSILVDADLHNIKGSAVHLQKLLMNLVNNSADAIEGSGTIEITLQNRIVDGEMSNPEHLEYGEYVYLQVKDTGAGIPEDNLKRIFEPFYSAKALGRKGTGLGMVIVWNTIKDHHGSIHIESEVGKGTAIHIFFPITREKASVRERGPEADAIAGNGERILVVDDTEAQRDIAMTILKSLNYSVTTVADGNKAIELYGEQKFDLVLLDMMMEPGISGLETTRRLLELDPGACIVIASGYSESGMVRDSIELGAKLFIQKPYGVNSLGAKISTVLQEQPKNQEETLR